MIDTFRKKYTPLNDKQILTVEEIKTMAEHLLREMDDAVPVGERSERGRCMAIARTTLETAIMWAVKGITTPQLEK